MCLSFIAFIIITIIIVIVIVIIMIMIMNILLFYSRAFSGFCFRLSFVLASRAIPKAKHFCLRVFLRVFWFCGQNGLLTCFLLCF